MLERKSALATAAPYISDVLRMGEVRGFTLTQIAGTDKDMGGKLPKNVGTALSRDGHTIFRIGPSQFWFIGEAPPQVSADCKLTPLSHSRTRIYLEGAPARDVLAKGIPLDFHVSSFTPGMFAQTGLHHTPVTVHCIGETRFELYALRTFAISVWEWLSDAALEYSSAT